MKLSQSFYFDAAHTLKNRYSDIYTKMCSERIHGHTYKATIVIEGEINEDGMIKDLYFVNLMVDWLKKKLDHQFLDEIEELNRPTLENLCLYIAKEAKTLDGLCEVSVERESAGNKCTLEIK